MATSNNQRRTIPIISKYELTALISERAAEIAAGQPITVPNPQTNDPIKIAWLEYESGTIPKKIIRTWPDGTREVWSIKDLYTF